MSMKPIVKWAGSKSSSLVDLLPYKFGRYYEPFFGSGSLFCQVKPPMGVISDKNAALMSLYRKVRNEPFDLCRQLHELETMYNNHSPSRQAEMYYDLRKVFNDHKTDVPALLVFLNKTCYNGLYRENRKGEYNVPFGKREKVLLYSIQNILEWREALYNSVILSGDFEQVFYGVVSRDFVFFDPPFDKSFSKEDHLRLARLFQELSANGVYCMLKGVDCRFIRKAYADYNIYKVDATKEVIITNYQSRKISSL